LEAPIVLTGSALGSNLGRIGRLNTKNTLILVGCACWTNCQSTHCNTCWHLHNG
jgi:hypothetical protein